MTIPYECWRCGHNAYRITYGGERGTRTVRYEKCLKCGQSFPAPAGGKRYPKPPSSDDVCPDTQPQEVEK